MSTEFAYIDRGNGEQHVTPQEYVDRFEALVLSGELVRMAKDDPTQFEAKMQDAAVTAGAMLREASKLTAATNRLGFLFVIAGQELQRARG